MCGGVKYTDKQNKAWTVYFASPKAALPVLKKDGEIEWITWGKRKEEDAPTSPNGGWQDWIPSKKANGNVISHAQCCYRFNPLWKRIATKPHIGST